jgi:hypothetical protein
MTLGVGEPMVVAVAETNERGTTTYQPYGLYTGSDSISKQRKED